MSQTFHYPRVLTIAGSDSGGGAGIQADLKTFSALGCYGMTAITALTAQNTLGVSGIHGVPPAFLKAQLAAVLDDIGVDAVKIGMLHAPEVVEVVAWAIDTYRLERVVLDPVMVATSGDRLIEEATVSALVRELFPRATVVTPNLDEAGLLLGRPVRDESELEGACADLLALGARAVLLKGGIWGRPVDRCAGAGRCTGRLLAAPDGPKDRQPQRPWHRLHAVVGDRGPPRAWPPAGRGGAGRPRLHPWGDRGGCGCAHGWWPWAAQPRPCAGAHAAAGLIRCLRGLSPPAARAGGGWWWCTASGCAARDRRCPRPRTPPRWPRGSRRG